MIIYVVICESLGGYTSCEAAFRKRSKALDYIKGKSSDIQSYDIEEVELI